MLERDPQKSAGRKNFILAGRDLLQNESKRGAVICCDQFSYEAQVVRSLSMLLF